MDKAVALHIKEYSKLFAEPAQHGWPQKFCFPEPTDEAQRAAFRLFRDTVGDMLGVKITVRRDGTK